MNTILDPAKLYITSSEWEIQGEIKFLIDLESVLQFVNKNKFTKIIWNDTFHLNLWDTPILPPWTLDKSHFARTVPILYSLINNNTIEFNFTKSSSKLSANPNFSFSYPEHIYNYFIDAIYNVNKHTKGFYIYLDKSNSHLVDKTINISNTENETITILNSTNIISITQWCQHNYLKDHCKKELIKKRWNPSKKYFPNIELCEVIEPSIEYYLQGARTKSEKTALIIARGSLIAELNGYTYNQTVSQKNSTPSKIRKIYEAGTANNKIFLSIDVKTGSFEVCDFTGNHKGEWNFEGQKIENADKKGGHNIGL